MSTVYETTQWRVAPLDRAAAKRLAEAAGVPLLVAHLLALRGIDTPEAAAGYLRPALAHLADPFSLTDMDRVVARIAQARDARETVLIFGDYDVDGIAATALLLAGLKRYGLERVDFGMPRRLTEGYGLNEERVDLAQEEGVGLIITVDNGISAHGAARRARELGIDLIVTDHHDIEDRLPDALAVLNPKRESADHPCAVLCGAGVAFKLACALNGACNDLDIAALGTIADIVPLRGENRTIVALGLRHMMKHRRVGIECLAAAAGIDIGEITSEKIGYQLGPRLNAAGRLDDALLALNLLLSTDRNEASGMARELNVANEQRRSIEREIVEDCLEELDAFFTQDMRSIVLARSDWHAGVIGIVASRLQTRYNRPVIVIAIDEDGVGRGSARSGPGFNMVGALSECQVFLERFGGHQAAAGLTIERSQIEGFRAAFEAEALRQLGPGPLAAELAIDVMASLGEIDAQLLNALDHLEPFGHKNSAPIFCSMGVEPVPNSLRVLKDEHLKFAVRQGNAELPVIGFGMAERFYTQDLSGPMDIAYTPKFNTWRGETKIQLLLKDIRPAT